MKTVAGTQHGALPRIDRISAADATVLASDHGPTPMNIGVVIYLGGGTPPPHADLGSILAERVRAVPRLRQRLWRVPFGCGRPVWVDDPDFAIDRHLMRRPWPAHGDDQQLLSLTAGLLCQRLRDDRPLWRACLVTDPAADRAALVLVMHHVLADGLGGLALLGALADPGPPAGSRPFPEPPPRIRSLALDAARRRTHIAWSALPALRRGIIGLRELGSGTRRPGLLPPTSLNRPTSNRRHLGTVVVPLPSIVKAAHQVGGTVNDVVLAAVTGALIAVLHGRGESPERIVVSVPISGRRAATITQLGNETGVRPIAVDALADDRIRLREIVEITKHSRGITRGSSAGPLGLAFRTLGRLGLFQFFINHQRLVHTFETNMRGPAQRLSLGGREITQLVPAVVNPGNVGVAFDVLSYAGSLVVTVVADPMIVPRVSEVTTPLEDGFANLIRASG